MGIVIHVDGSRPVSGQLEGQIRRAVLRDEIGPGEALPTSRQLAGDLLVDEKIVARAYRALERDAILRSRIGRAPVVDERGKQRLLRRAEIALAREIHDTLVSPVRIEGGPFEALGVARPAQETGGDLIDAVEHDGVTDLFVADVAGHGVGAGIVMAMLKASIRMGLRGNPDLPRLLGGINDVLTDTTSAGLYATCTALRIAPDRVELVLAGHHPVAHYRAETGTIERAGQHHFPLGMFADRAYACDRIALAPGDLLAIYTDGLHETADPSGAELGHDAIASALAAHAGASLETIRRAILDTVDSHGEQHDDRTLLLVRRTR